MNDDADAQAANSADAWLRERAPIPIAQRRRLQQRTTFELLARIDDLATELRGERARADRLEMDLVLARRALALTRREQRVELRDRAVLAASAVLILLAAILAGARP